MIDPDYSVTARRMIWTDTEWFDVARFENCDYRTGSVPESGTLTHEEDLPASWHQQSNGGRRIWTAVTGEFETRK